MINSIKKLFGFDPKVDYAELVKKGAVVLDVRTKDEYAQGHIDGSINISVDVLTRNLNKLQDKNKPIITCCASGGRSESAKNVLKFYGYTHVYNGGSWTSLQNKIR